MKTVEDLNLSGKRVLIRADFNVPLDDGIVDDNFRIKAALPTINYCLNEGAAVVIMSHLGRPKGAVVPELSLLPVGEELQRLLERDIIFSRDCASDHSIGVSEKLEPGQVHLLENLRFYSGEEANDAQFAARLARHGNVYINDAFGTAHRAHASNVAVVSHFSETGIGYLMAKELRFLREELSAPESPYAVVLGGAKISGKLQLIRQLIKTADLMIIGGGMAFTFLKAQGKNVGKSLVDESLIDEARFILEEAEQHGTELLLPTDVVASTAVSVETPWRVATLDELGDDEMGVDIGPETCASFGMALAGAKTILWNGPMGVFELGPFQTGTEIIIDVIIQNTRDGAISVVGGGDSASAIHKLSDVNQFTHISTGGGASLALLSGQTLPAQEALS